MAGQKWLMSVRKMKLKKSCSQRIYSDAVDTITAITDGKIKKGDFLSVAQVGGICGAKKNMGFDTYVP